MKKLGWTTVLVVLSVSIPVTYLYFVNVDLANSPRGLALHNQIVSETAPGPFRYRVLLPALANPVVKVFQTRFPETDAFLITYALVDFVSVASLLLLLAGYLRYWCSAQSTLIGVLFVSSTLPLILKGHWFHPWSVAEVPLLTMSLILILNQRFIALCLVTVLASLNRETSLLIPVLYAFVHFNSIRSMETAVIVRSISLFALWAVVFVGLRVALGPAAEAISTSEVLARNFSTTSVVTSVGKAALALGVFWIFAILGFKNAPHFLKMVAFVSPVYLAAVCLWGVWQETRLLLPLFVLLLPVGVVFLDAKLPALVKETL